MQISTSVQQTTEVVALMPAAPTLQVAPPVPVYLDTTEMESLVPVNKRVAISVTKQLLHRASYLIKT